MKREKLEELLSEAKRLNEEIESKEELDYNEILSYLYRKGIIKALSNKDAKYGRLPEVQKKYTKLEPKFKGFKVVRDEADNKYKDVSFYKDIQLVGEMLGYDLGSDQFGKKYYMLADKPFPLYFGWFSPNVLVTMKAESTESGIRIQGNIKDILDNLPEIPGSPSEFNIDTENLDPQVKKSMLVFFAEGAAPRTTPITSMQSLVVNIAKDLAESKEPETVV